MSIVADLIARLIASGTPPEVAAVAVAEAFAAGAASTVSGGIPVDRAAEKRRAYDRERKAAKRNSTGLPVESPVDAVLYISKNKKEEENKRDAKQPKFRGTRLDENWRPNREDWQAAVDRLGAGGADLELRKFHDHWKAAAGAKGVKLDWDATFRNWIRNARASPSGRGPPSPSFAEIHSQLSARMNEPSHDSPSIQSDEQPAFDLDLTADRHG